MVGIGLLVLLIPTTAWLWPLGVGALASAVMILVATWETLSLRSDHPAVRMTNGGA